jgi:hypothetical protein
MSRMGTDRAILTCNEDDTGASGKNGYHDQNDLDDVVYERLAVSGRINRLDEALLKQFTWLWLFLEELGSFRHQMKSICGV